VTSEWRARLREAIERSGRKHEVIAWDAGTRPETLSRILHAHHVRPYFETIVRIIHAAGESVGWLLYERGYRISMKQRHQLRTAAAIVLNMTGGDDGEWPDEG